MFQRTWRDTGLLALAIALGLAVYSLSQLLAHPLLLVLAAIVIASAIAPIARFVERWVPRVVGVLVVYLAVALVLAGIGWLIIPALVEQAQQLVDQAPSLADQAERWVEDQGVPIQGNIGDQIRSALTEGAQTIILLAPSTFSAGLEILLVVAMAAYLTVSGPAMLEFVLTLFPPDRRDYARNTLSEVSQTMGGYVRGSIIDGAIIGTITWIGLMLLGVDFPIVLALVAFIGELVPVLGPIIAAIPAIGIAATDSLTLALAVAGFYFLLQQFESYVLLPAIMRQQADIPPLLTLVALLAGNALAGFIGALLAIPLFGGAFVLFKRVAVPALLRENQAPEHPHDFEGGGRPA